MAPNTDDDVLVLAFYLLVDVSASMSGEPITAVNEILPEIIDAIQESPTLGDVVRLGAVSFSDSARVVLRLGDLRDVDQIPQFKIEGGTSYAAGFRQLRKDIDSDLAQLKSDGYKVYRPAVSLSLTAILPTSSTSSTPHSQNLPTLNSAGGPISFRSVSVSGSTKQHSSPGCIPSPPTAESRCAATPGWEAVTLPQPSGRLPSC